MARPCYAPGYPAARLFYEVSTCSILTTPATWGGGIISPMKKEVGLKHVLTVPCPTCGATKGKECELTSGKPRTSPHRDRRINAKDNEK
jgi:hypothetical protein